MRKHYTDEEKTEIINRYLYGETNIALSKLYNISRSTIYNWINIIVKIPKEVTL